MAKRDNLIFQALHIIAWIIFVGLSIEAGGLIVNFIFSLYNPEMIDKLYQKLDLSQMYQQNSWVFFAMYGSLLVVAILKAILFYTVIQVLTRLDLSKPFSDYAAEKIQRLAIISFWIGIISLIASKAAVGLADHGFETSKLSPFWVDYEAYILMAAVVYVIALIFKRGVDLQTESDLTV